MQGKEPCTALLNLSRRQEQAVHVRNAVIRCTVKCNDQKNGNMPEDRNEIGIENYTVPAGKTSSHGSFVRVQRESPA